MWELKNKSEELYLMGEKNSFVETVNGNVMYWDWCIDIVNQINKLNPSRCARIVESNDFNKVAVWAKCYNESDIGMSAFYAKVGQ